MKKICTTIVAVVAFIQFSYAQWGGTYPGPIYYTGSNVTIGTTNLGLGVLQVKGSTTSNPAIATITPGAAQGEISDITFYSTFKGTPDNGPRRTADVLAGFNSGWGGEYLTLNVGLNGVQNDGNVVTLEKLRILANGYVGIGTTTPDAKLAVNGSIHSQEVKVDMTGWSDYVFKPTYKLPSLSEVKTYIDLNQHLPEIPSEQEVVKNGVNLGEMNKLLLKKVEELTLYLIEKDKEVKEQQELNKQILQRLELLEKKN